MLKHCVAVFVFFVGPPSSKRISASDFDKTQNEFDKWMQLVCAVEERPRKRAQVGPKVKPQVGPKVKPIQDKPTIGASMDGSAGSGEDGSVWQGLQGQGQDEGKGKDKCKYSFEKLSGIAHKWSTKLSSVKAQMEDTPRSKGVREELDSLETQAEEMRAQFKEKAAESDDSGAKLEASVAVFAHWTIVASRL